MRKGAVCLRRKWTWKRTLGVFLLAAVCIGGSELAACYIAAPALYERITAPVRHQAVSLWESARTLAGQVRDRVSPAKPEEGTLETDSPTSEALISDAAARAPETLTALTQLDGMEILTGGSRQIVYFNQADPAWSARPYGSDTIDKYGCGPTTLAMVLHSLTGAETDPEQVAQWASESGYWAKHGGSYLSIINGAANSFGLTAESVPDCSADRLRLELSAGKLAIALMRPGHFTSAGHFLLLRGVTLDGGILVADSNSRERSLAVWDAQLILDELSPSRGSGAPLWFLSLPAEG